MRLSKTKESRWRGRWNITPGLYSRESIISDATLKAVGRLPVMDEKPMQRDGTQQGKQKTRLPAGTGPDRIPTEVIKSAKGVLLGQLHEVLCQCWEEGAVPQDMRDCNIVTLHRNKGDRSGCNNYRGISSTSLERSSPACC